MITINIDHQSCIKCSKCVKVCPAYILTQENKNAEIGLINVQTCIGCGHCVAACPTDSVIHSLFPQDKVHALHREILPSPEQMMELIKARRSNRAFLSSAVPEEHLRQIVRAASLAPTASNGQEVSYTLVTDPKLLQQICDITVQTFEETVRKITHPLIKPIVNMVRPDAKHAVPSLKGVITKQKSGTDAILHNAKAVLFIHTPALSNFGRQDANLAYQNASLMAESLGVSQFYTGYVCIAIDLDKKKRLAKALNIKGTIHAGMAMAMPAFKFAKYVDRKDLDLSIL